MSSETELVNSALRRVGETRITALSDVVPRAGVANDILAAERDAALVRHTWNFATTRVELAVLATAPAFEFTYAFVLPADYLRVVSVSDSNAGGGSPEYKIEAVDQGSGSFVNCILCNYSRLWLRYVRRVTTVSLMHVGFQEVLVLRMAKIFAIACANSSTLREQMDEDLKRTVREMKSIDAIEDYPERLPEGSWLTERWGSWA